MAIPAILAAPAIGAGVSALGNFFGSMFGANKQDKINQQQQDFALQMYQRQQADNQAQWAMQNEYNSPQSQMQRLRDAGLNPNMVYGSGSAVQQAGPIKGAEAPQWNPKSVAPDIGGAISGGLNSYYDLTQKQAQTDNLKAQNTILLQDALLKSAQTAGTVLQNSTRELELDKANELFRYTIDGAKAVVQKQIYDADKSYSDLRFTQNTQQSRIDVANLNPAAARAKIQQTITQSRNTELDNEFKTLENNMRKNGINSSDPIYFRIIGQLLNKFGFTINK